MVPQHFRGPHCDLSKTRGTLSRGDRARSLLIVGRLTEYSRPWCHGIRCNRYPDARNLMVQDRTLSGKELTNSSIPASWFEDRLTETVQDRDCEIVDVATVTILKVARLD